MVKLKLVRKISLLLVSFIILSSVSWLSPSLQAEEEETYILINKTKNQLYVVMNNVKIFTFPVATGRGDSTPVGEFKVVTKVVNPYYLPKKIAGGDPNNPLGTRWMGLNIGNGYKYGIHGTNRAWSIGHPISSGCIRMHNKHVEYLYRHLPLRTRVVIVE